MSAKKDKNRVPQEKSKMHSQGKHPGGGDSLSYSLQCEGVAM